MLRYEIRLLRDNSVLCSGMSARSPKAAFDKWVKRQMQAQARQRLNWRTNIVFADVRVSVVA